MSLAIVIAIIIGAFFGFLKGLREIRARNTNKTEPSSYTVGFTVTKKSDIEAGTAPKTRTMPDLSPLEGSLSRDELDRMTDNMKKVERKHGGDELFLLKCYLTSGTHYTDPVLMPGDEVRLDIADIFRASDNSFILVPYYDGRTGRKLGSLYIDAKDEGFELIDKVKITGAYIADIDVWTSGKFAPSHHNIIVFYEGRDDGDSGGNDEMTPTDTFGLVCLLTGWLKQQQQKV